MKNLVVAFSVSAFVAASVSCHSPHKTSIKGKYDYSVAESNSNHLDSIVLQGRVFDRASKTPLLGAVVEAVHTSYGTLSDSMGYYKLVIPVGQYKIKASRVGFTPITTKWFMLQKSGQIQFFLGNTTIYCK